MKIQNSIYLVVFLLTSCINQPATKVYENTMWYAQPAEQWEESLPIGNGRIGAMVYGRTDIEHIQLNDDSMWPGKMEWNNPVGRPEDLKKIRQYLIEGKNDKADALLIEKFSNKSVGRSHQTLGDLFIELNHDNVTDYRRELDLETAIATTTYKTNGKEVTEKVFATNPHQAIIIELSSKAEEGLNGKLLFSRPEDEGHPTVTVSVDDSGNLLMDGEVTQYGGAFDSKPDPITYGVKFQTRLKVVNQDGEVISGDDYLELKGVKKAVIYLVSNSSFYHDDYITQNKKQLQNVVNNKLAKVEEEHIKDHQQFYSRVHINLEHDRMDSIPTDARLKRIQEGAIDLGMEELLFNYGRYLLIGCSREGTLAANLQGLWNPHIFAPWNGDYHLNINLQMNYWLANNTNLDELNMPLFDYVDRLIENGKETAKVNFGCRGSFIPHATDIWAVTWLRAPTAYWGGSFGAGGWLMQHYWQHYEYTQDKEFLKNRAYPAIKEVAQFYSDWLIEDPRDGSLVAAPSTSPENQFYNTDGKAVASCMGSAMDQQVIAEVFGEYVAACEVLEEDNELLQTIKDQLTRLRPGFVVGSDGRIQEWDREYKEVEPGHRHMSHLYGFHPGITINENNHPELMEGIKKTLQYRLDNGGAGTGWSRAWLINLYARLLDGDEAHKHIQFLFQRSMYLNLFDSHPPFQIDGNFGYSAGLAELLVQSHKGYIEFLPALPSAYENGAFDGLKVRGDAVVSAQWENNQLRKAKLVALKQGDFKILNPKSVREISAKVDGKKVEEREENGVLQVSLTKGQVLEISCSN
ncbi:glycoside hydrolase family 95 protein [Carboxylicivirga linearis]|uniref:Glycoside hydrolase family 95 protein n=1 Tax=Carboxylicivirga linearis TaxID=1628157 RepID=A0ABS5K1V8_9BACT|nr:glycoside hydrolase N-terminal domain-containing protein [Carboxylicivirga linearis]MBS2100651.1 glycoside hydrolase family 95 protein [Carboxylicivirga linearis]